MLVYIRNGNVFVAKSREQAKAVYGFELGQVPDAELSDTEWKKCSGIVRLVNGELVYGYTEKELKQQKNAKVRSEIRTLIQKLKATDYIAIKLAEGAATTEEYADKITKRQEWRNRINELQEELQDVGSN